MMERKFCDAPKNAPPLWYCNPELNTECKKTTCKYNLNANERLCNATTKKNFALKTGEKAEVRGYPPVEKIGV
jgi:hypothetical protein